MTGEERASYSSRYSEVASYGGAETSVYAAAVEHGIKPEELSNEFQQSWRRQWHQFINLIVLTFSVLWTGILANVLWVYGCLLYTSRCV